MVKRCLQCGKKIKKDGFLLPNESSYTCDYDCAYIWEKSRKLYSIVRESKKGEVQFYETYDNRWQDELDTHNLFVLLREAKQFIRDNNLEVQKAFVVNVGELR